MQFPYTLKLDGISASIDINSKTVTIPKCATHVNVKALGAGGGSGGAGGAGGLTTATIELDPTNSYVIVVGSAGGPSSNGYGAGGK